MYGDFHHFIDSFEITHSGFSNSWLFVVTFHFLVSIIAVRGGAVRWGTALQAGRSWVRFPMVSLEFFIDSLSGRTMALGSTQPLTEMSTRTISWGVKGGRCVGLTTLHVQSHYRPVMGLLYLLQRTSENWLCSRILRGFSLLWNAQIGFRAHPATQ